mmetsp:Transcript_23213/g.80869  ORF Transcript_23213/g.80869 Transcript_23213/m.80869 type:complete len:442 (-) Transcript_23213:57-1382(-)
MQLAQAAIGHNTTPTRIVVRNSRFSSSRRSLLMTTGVFVVNRSSQSSGISTRRSDESPCDGQPRSAYMLMRLLMSSTKLSPCAARVTAAAASRCLIATTTRMCSRTSPGTMRSASAPSPGMRSNTGAARPTRVVTPACSAASALTSPADAAAASPSLMRSWTTARTRSRAAGVASSKLHPFASNSHLQKGVISAASSQQSPSAHTSASCSSCKPRTSSTLIPRPSAAASAASPLRAHSIGRLRLRVTNPPPHSAEHTVQKSQALHAQSAACNARQAAAGSGGGVAATDTAATRAGGAWGARGADAGCWAYAGAENAVDSAPFTAGLGRASSVPCPARVARATAPNADAREGDDGAAAAGAATASDDHTAAAATTDTNNSLNALTGAIAPGVVGHVRSGDRAAFRCSSGVARGWFDSDRRPRRRLSTLQCACPAVSVDIAHV